MDSSGFLPEGVPAHWAVYLRVADTDAAVKTTVELGGALVMPAEDTPYGPEQRRTLGRCLALCFCEQRRIDAIGCGVHVVEHALHARVE